MVTTNVTTKNLHPNLLAADTGTFVALPFQRALSFRLCQIWWEIHTNVYLEVASNAHFRKYFRRLYLRIIATLH
jgi:hypothetical protein